MLHVPPSDEFFNFYDGTGLVLDSQHYIHPCNPWGLGNLEPIPQGPQGIFREMDPLKCK